MAETFMINQLMIKSKGTMKLKRQGQDKVMIIQQVACWIINILKKITN